MNKQREEIAQPDLQLTCNQLATDTISRQSAIDVADRADYTGLAVEDVKKVTDEVVKGLKRLPSAEPRWIPCSERLPDKPGSYICTCSDGTPYTKVTVIKFHPRTQAWDLTGTRAYWKVRAWMTLPDPWKGEKE